MIDPFVVVILVVIAVACGLPGIIALLRDSLLTVPVLLINFLLGGTIIGWIVALVMALSSRPRAALAGRPGWS